MIADVGPVDICEDAPIRSVEHPHVDSHVLLCQLGRLKSSGTASRQDCTVRDVSGHEQPSGIEPLLSLEEAAEALNVSVKSVRRLLERGELRGVRIGDRRRLIEVAELRRYVAERRDPMRLSQQDDD